MKVEGGVEVVVERGRMSVGCMITLYPSTMSCYIT